MEVQRVMYILLVKDMERAVRFYTKVIGFKGRFSRPRWNELVFGDFTLALHIDEGDAEPRSTGLSLTVTDIDAACREIEAAGGKVIGPPHDTHIPGLRLATTLDSEGNPLELGEHIE